MIQISGSSTEYPFRNIDLAVLDLLNASKETLIRSEREICKPVLKMLECFLQVSKYQLDLEIMRGPKFVEICTLYVGAINSPNFIQSSHTNKYALTKTFMKLTQHLASHYGAHQLPDIHLSTVTISNEVNELITRFEALKLDEEKLWLWNGWFCKNRMGKIHWPPLYPIYERLGRDFTEKLHLACIEYLAPRNDTRVPCIRTLARFINEYPGHLDQNMFQAPGFVKRFWLELYVDFMKTGYANGSKLKTLEAQWSYHFINFVEGYLVPSGLFAETWGDLPRSPIKSISTSQTHVRQNNNGELIKEKLITDIPLDCSDEDALHLLFHQIQSDVDTAINWAKAEIKSTWSRYQIRKSNELKGNVLILGTITGKNNGNRWAKDRKNPEHLANAASTLLSFGHIADTYIASLMMPKPLTQTAYELALPIKGTLIPHCSLLVAHHPQITPSFLENFELYDKNNNLTGFVEFDNGYKLISHKRRKGSDITQQSIVLNETTTEVIKQIIALTSSIRTFLKKNGDDDWRYLLLTCKQGFSYPKRIKHLSSEFSYPLAKKKLTRSLETTTTMNQLEIERFSQRFSLMTLRASCGVLVYLNTRSIKEMSEALGHTKLDMDLIKRYLPEPILAFFQERWIRIFQTAILVVALKDSPRLVEASGFANINELDSFLKTHAINLSFVNQHEHSSEIFESNNASKDEIVFGINTTILTILVSLQLAVQHSKCAVHEKAKYWAELTRYLVTHLDSIKLNRPDIHTQLKYAQANADPVKMEHLIYG